ncbi:hypothetical protein [Prauserella shujinwangii]|uniref:hypothetical protein n=1 Tax=Prauserella shujinwangii TaxID=1453103 RepID=UPI000D05083E|nr:hypothetical protein [Prauserella shujinwangii]
MHETRSFLAEALGTEYVWYPTLAEAARDPNAAVVLSGDYGGTIFLTAPVRLVGCDLGALRTLVSDLDAVSWMSGDPTIATVAIERHPGGTGVLGGDGGGLVTDGVWVHPRRVPEEIHDQARDVVLGRRARIDVDVLRLLRERELARRKERRAAHASRLGLAWDFDISPPAVPFEG